MKNLSLLWSCQTLWTKRRSTSNSYFSMFVLANFNSCFLKLSIIVYSTLLHEHKDLFIDMDVRNNRSELAIANRHQER